ncbi:MAG: hypothetical protein HY233_03365 [Acidobacteriales bacterium]|nr:hypothetical protein [Candidatus Koribacter versatilis]MBI3644990.1 hypothetical protein [Terriglobales bacterium]
MFASAVAQTPAPTAKPAAPEDENGKKARALIDRAVQALGGQAYLTTQTRGEEGRWYSLYHGQSRGAGVQYRQFNRFPDQDRLEIIGRGNIVVPLPLVGIIVVSHEKKNKNDIVIIHNGDKGYETTYKGTAAQDKEDLTAYLRRRQHSLEQVLRKWISDPTMEYFNDGLAIVDGKPTDQVTLLNNQNDSVSVYLDQNTHLPLKTSFTWRDPEDKQKNVEEEVYDNYRLVQGIMTPHSITRTFNGEMSHQRFINVAKYNLPLPETMFEASVDYDPRQPLKKR